MNGNEIKEIIATVVVIYPSFTPSEQTPSVWLALLQDYHKSQVMLALKAYAKSNEFPPSPGALIKLIEISQGKELWTAAEALDWVRRLASKYRYMTEEQKQQARNECQQLTKDTLHMIGFHRFLPSVMKIGERPAYNPWVTPTEPEPIERVYGLFVKTYEGLRLKEIKREPLQRLSANENKLLAELGLTDSKEVQQIEEQKKLEAA